MYTFINVSLFSAGNIDYKGRDLCEILFDMEENPEEFEDVDVPDDADVNITTSEDLEELGKGRCFKLLITYL